jgi:uncharacterized protein
MILRREQVRIALELLRRNPVVALLGARQIGKTTLAHQVARARGGSVHFFDLEDPRDVARLEDPMAGLAPLRGLVVLDEIQRRAELFPVLRVLADRARVPARFLVLGSASPALLRQSSESLAGRIAYSELGGLDLSDVGIQKLTRLWVRGGFPRSFLARSESASLDWRREFIRTFLEQDLPQLGVRIPGTTLRRFWSMLAHYHGQTLNSSELARAFGVADTTIRHYLDILAATFVVRQLQPWHANIGKRQIKAPRIYLADSGLLHSLLDINDEAALERHPKVGASWEGFALSTVVRRLGVRPEECYYWRTHDGAELDLFVRAGNHRLGFEFKRNSAPVVTPSMRSALRDLDLQRLDVVYPGGVTFPMGPGIRALPLSAVPRELEAVKKVG